MMEKVTITRDSTLIETKWVPPSESGAEGYYKDELVENISPYYLYERDCFLEEGITLREMFIFLNKQKELWHLYIGNWCLDYINVSLASPVSSKCPFKKLELTWEHEVSKYKGDANFEVNLSYKMGLQARDQEDEIYGLSLSNFLELIDIPVEINKNSVIYKEDFSDDIKCEEIYLGEQVPNLFQVIYGIFWELSFFGSPEDALNKIEEIKSICDEFAVQINK